jgi:serine/threonine-protein kinase
LGGVDSNWRRNMKVCAVCGSNQPDIAAFCSNCGNSITKKSSGVRLRGTEGVYSIVPDTPPLGEGRDSLVLRALDHANNEVCVKLYSSYVEVSPKWKEFYKEITVSKVLTHPNVLPILDYGIQELPNSAPFLVLPLCEGGNLRTLIEKRDFLSLEEFLPILDQIALAIDFSHSKGIIHGDIKPENILFLNNTSHAYIADFGTSRFFAVKEHITEPPGRDLPGVGTTVYLSPEQVEENVQTPRSDVYALALVAYESLTGRLPFDTSQTTFQQMKDKIEGNYIDPRDANPSLTKKVRDALLAGLSKKPKYRPHTAIGFCQMLRGIKEVTLPKENKGKFMIRVQYFWDSLPPTQKVAIVTGLIAALATIVVALIEIVPTLFP